MNAKWEKTIQSIVQINMKSAKKGTESKNCHLLEKQDSFQKLPILMNRCAFCEWGLIKNA